MDLFCDQCCLNFGNNFLHGLHLKLVHKEGADNALFYESLKTKNEFLNSESSISSQFEIQNNKIGKNEHFKLNSVTYKEGQLTEYGQNKNESVVSKIENESLLVVLLTFLAIIW